MKAISSPGVRSLWYLCIPQKYLDRLTFMIHGTYIKDFLYIRRRAISRACVEITFLRNRKLLLLLMELLHNTVHRVLWLGLTLKMSLKKSDIVVVVGGVVA